MRIIAFLFIASALIVFEAQPRRLIKRDIYNTEIYPTDQPPTKHCGNCVNMEFKIKCGGKHNSKSCYGCELKCHCKDDQIPPPSPPPTIYIPPTNYPPPILSPSPMTYPTPLTYSPSV